MESIIDKSHNANVRLWMKGRILILDGIFICHELTQKSEVAGRIRTYGLPLSARLLYPLSYHCYEFLRSTLVP